MLESLPLGGTKSAINRINRALVALGVAMCYSYIMLGLPNYGMAPGSLFLIKETGLADPNTPALQSSGAPGIPTSLSGASISVTVNGVPVHPGMYYAIPTRIADVLPSSTPAGTESL